jgi:hypothetical protein
VDQAYLVRLGQGVRHLGQDVNHPARRQRAETVNELVDGQAIDVLHRVVVDAVLRDPEVEDLHRAGVGEPAGLLDFALE